MAALFSALNATFLYFAAVWPTGQLGLVALSSLFVAAAIIESGIAPGIYVFAASCAVGLLIIPYKTPVLLYMLFFGYYPVLKSLIERIGNSFFQWVLKLAVFNASAIAAWFFVKDLFLGFGDIVPGILPLCLGGSAVFALYDFGFTKVIWFYINRVRNKIK